MLCKCGCGCVVHHPKYLTTLANPESYQAGRTDTIKHCVSLLRAFRATHITKPSKLWLHDREVILECVKLIEEKA